MTSPARGHQPPTRTPSRLRGLLPWKCVLSCILVLLLLGPLVWWQSPLRDVPDIGDPFPVSELLEPIPAETNAYPLFEEAYALLVPVSDEDSQEYHQQEDDGWDPTDDVLNDYLELNRPALEKWRAATERNDFQVVPVLELTDGIYLPNFGAVRDLICWSHVEIERLAEIGRPAQALPWLRASFRASALITRNEPWLSTMVGTACFAISVDSAETWMHYSAVTADELLRLASVVQESTRLMERPSTIVKLECLVSRRESNAWSYEEMRRVYDQMEQVALFDFDPPFDSRVEVWLRAEPEFSRRLIAHMTVNHLAHVDAPRRGRPPLLDDDLFDAAPPDEAPDGILPPADLLPLLRSSKLIKAEERSLLASHLEAIERCKVRSACLQVALVSQAYHRRHGEFPDELSELQPKYLAELPDDPYSPDPASVVYRRTGEEAVVYSQYTNGEDDGGAIVTHEEARGAYLPDFGLRIRAPDSSRPVAAPDR